MQQEVYTKYNPKEKLRFAFTIVKDQHSLICGDKHIELISNTLHSYNSIRGLKPLMLNFSHSPVHIAVYQGIGLIFLEARACFSVHTVNFDCVRKFRSGTGYAYGAGYRCTERKAPIFHHVLGGLVTVFLTQIVQLFGIDPANRVGSLHYLHGTRRGVSNARI